MFLSTIYDFFLIKGCEREREREREREGGGERENLLVI